MRRALSALSALLLALVWQRLYHHEPPTPTDPLVANVSEKFQAVLSNHSVPLNIHKRGVLNWDQDTFLWNRLAAKFGINPNTPYMYNILTLSGLFPSPIWRLQHHDAVVLLFQRPPPVEYFSFTTFCLGSPKRGLVFASLGDSLNSHSPMMRKTNLKIFAHVVVTESSHPTLLKIKDSLMNSGVSKDAIHVAVVPNSVVDDEPFVFYEGSFENIPLPKSDRRRFISTIQASRLLYQGRPPTAQRRDEPRVTITTTAMLQRPFASQEHS